MERRPLDADGEPRQVGLPTRLPLTPVSPRDGLLRFHPGGQAPVLGALTLHSQRQ